MRSLLHAVARAMLLVAVATLAWVLPMGTATVGAAGGGGAAGTGIAAARLAASVTPGWRKEMLASINALRAQAGVRPLRACPALRRSAQSYATVMSMQGQFGHVGPDGSEPAVRMVREGYRWRALAENIAAGQRTVAQVMADWNDSAGHYANLVNPAYRHVGLGHASMAASEYGHYWVQDFGRGRGC